MRNLIWVPHDEPNLGSSMLGSSRRGTRFGLFDEEHDLGSSRRTRSGFLVKEPKAGFLTMRNPTSSNPVCTFF
ncbi:hypothetical protein SLEP1_g20158 [Rubroshorea leprosula]|uniref:Uncharacterized protein n=1 Tax=Rubroshorea leprosula TaxID=152421 RepID=A0AAV5JDR0_9ROSI|nr:hypothetical protein SLEP1_g20158 [Rubroshorea leprosula]